MWAQTYSKDDGELVRIDNGASFDPETEMTQTPP
jgi:hypothetical protein